MAAQRYATQHDSQSGNQPDNQLGNRQSNRQVALGTAKQNVAPGGLGKAVSGYSAMSERGGSGNRHNDSYGNDWSSNSMQSTNGFGEAGRTQDASHCGTLSWPSSLEPLECSETSDSCEENPYARPLLLSRVAAGFPSPADDYLEQRLDLNKLLVRNPPATFFVRAHGESMLGAGIHDQDILVVDRSVEARHGRVIIAALEGELTVKRLWRQNGRIALMPENDGYPPIEIGEGRELIVWGVVTAVVHQL